MDVQEGGLKQQEHLRKQAVMLRLQKKSLNDIQQQTGLSHPTIIAAYKKFLAGGWKALEMLPRGRPSGTKGLKKLHLGGVIKKLIHISAPVNGLWSIEAVQRWLAENYQEQASAKTIGRYLKECGFIPPDETFIVSRQAAQQWCKQQGVYPEKRQKPAVFICGVRNFSYEHGASTGYQVYLKDLKNRVQWLHSDAPLGETSIIKVASAVLDDCPEGMMLIVKSPFLQRYQELRAWVNQQQNVCLIPHGELNLQAGGIDRKTPPETIHKANNCQSKGTDMPLTHLERLEAESIQIMREVVAETENPVMLYSIGKDSAVMLHIAMKAFYPSLPPFPLLHVDTRWKFREMYEFRDKMVQDLGLELLTYVNPEGIEKDINPFTHGSAIHTDIMKTEALKQALNKYGFDAAFGGARRDEEKSRAKERIFSFRTADHRWDPKSQRPEIWKQYNARKHKGESIRVFPLSNWTELDIWQYIYLENVPIVPLYYSAERPVVERDGVLIMVDDERMPLRDGEVPMMKKVRFRTLGCYPLTGAVESEADTLPAIIQEMLLTKTSERQGRVIDHDSAASMEKKKQEGYF